MQGYELIDSGEGQKLERFGEIVLARPCAQALWYKSVPKEWEKADASFSRESEAKWSLYRQIPECWEIEHKTLKFQIERTSFGHVGLFPEHSLLWDWLEQEVKKCDQPEVLNLFGYTGATTLFLAKQNAKVCHLDASKKIVEKAKDNARLNHMEDYPIRWIVDDVFKFLKREVKRERKYDGVILDPPSFGRGSKGEVFKFEEHLVELLELVRQVLSDNPQFLLLTCHTTGVTPLVLKNMLSAFFNSCHIEVGELALPSKHHHLPKGIYAKCSFK